MNLDKFSTIILSIEFLKNNPNQEFTAREIAENIIANNKELAKQKKDNSA